MSTRNAISSAVRRALLERTARAATIGCALFVVATSASGQAQPGPQRAGSQPEEVVVTGSRIRRDTFNSVSPVQLVTREEVIAAGFTSATEALQGTAVTNGGAQINNAFGGFVTDGGPGANTLSLRGLGAGRTLVLINGRRVAPSGTRGAVGSADLNVLPNAIIDHIEILKDGASSIYGSDAIAGVVNVVTLDNPEGFTFEAQYNSPLDGGGEQGRVSLVGGWGGDRWSFGGSLEYYDRGSLTLADRDWTRCNMDMLRDPVTGASLDFVEPTTGQPKCYPITGTGSNGVTINTIGTNPAGLPGVGAPGSVGTTFNRWRPNPAVTTGAFPGFEGVGGGANNLNVRDTFDPRTLNRSLISPGKTSTAFLQATYDLGALGDAELYFDFLGHRRESQQTGYRQMTMDYRQGSPLIPSNLAASVFGADPGTTRGATIGVRAFIGFGNDLNEQTINFYKPAAGLRGDIGSEWRYDAHMSFSTSDAQYLFQAFLLDNLQFASNVVPATAGVDPALVRNGLTCNINLTNPAERCIPFPPLDNAVIGGAVPADFDRLHLARHRRQHRLRRERVRRDVRRSRRVAAGRPRAGRVRLRASGQPRSTTRPIRTASREQSLQFHERGADARRGQRRRGVRGDRSAAARRQAGRPRADDERFAAVHGLRLVRLRQHVQVRRHVQPDRLVFRARHAGHVVPRAGAVRAVPGRDERLLEPAAKTPATTTARQNVNPVRAANCASELAGNPLVRRSSRRAASPCSVKAEPRRASRPRPPTT